MSRPHWRVVAVVVAGLTILSVPGYAQITVEAVRVSALTTARQTERSLVELTRDGGNSTDHGWRVRQAPRQGSASDQGFCSVCGVLAGAGLGFAAHESGHLVANWALGTDVYVKKVVGLGVPFSPSPIATLYPDGRSSSCRRLACGLSLPLRNGS